MVVEDFFGAVVADDIGSSPRFVGAVVRRELPQILEDPRADFRSHLLVRHGAHQR